MPSVNAASIHFQRSRNCLSSQYTILPPRLKTRSETIPKGRMSHAGPLLRPSHTLLPPHPSVVRTMNALAQKPASAIDPVKAKAETEYHIQKAKELIS